MPTPNSVDEYLASLPDDRRATVESLRTTINAAAPGAIETIAYQMPALRLDGRFLVSYAAYRDHYSLFPASEAVVAALGDDVAPYLRGKGTISFPAREPVPLELVARIVAIRVAEEVASRAR